MSPVTFVLTMLIVCSSHVYGNHKRDNDKNSIDTSTSIIEKTQILTKINGSIFTMSNPTKMNFVGFIEVTKIYVDKTLLVKKIIEMKGAVTIITCPRKWGKSVNLNMLKLFFEKETLADDYPRQQNFAKNFFKHGLVNTSKEGIISFNKPPLISHETEFLAKHFQKYPVVYIDFSAEFPVNDYLGSFKNVIAKLYYKHSYLLENWYNIVDKTDTSFVEKKRVKTKIKEFEKILEQKTDGLSDLTSSVHNLCSWLYEFHKEKVILLIDEYDRLHNNFIFLKLDIDTKDAENAFDFINNFLCLTLKDPDKCGIQLAVVTGILNFARAALQSALNNVINDLNLIDMKDLTPFYGFTGNEVDEVLQNTIDTAKLADKELIIDWYDGYDSLSYHNIKIFSPWSIMGYVREGKLRGYWTESATTGFIENLCRYDKFYNAIYDMAKRNKVYYVHEDYFINFETNICMELRTLSLKNPNAMELYFDGYSKTTDGFVTMLSQLGYLTISREVVAHRKIGLRVPNNEIIEELDKFITSAERSRLRIVTNNDAYVGRTLTSCTDSLRNWFLNDGIDEQSSFHQLYSSSEKLYQLTKFLNLDKVRNRKLSIPCLHYNERSVRSRFHPVIEGVRDIINGSIKEERQKKIRQYNKSFRLDTLLFVGNRALIIEYKCDEKVPIHNVLLQAKNYSALLLHNAYKEWKFDQFSFLAINLLQNQTLVMEREKMDFNEFEVFVKNFHAKNQP